MRPFSSFFHVREGGEEVLHVLAGALLNRAELDVAAGLAQVLEVGLREGLVLALEASGNAMYSSSPVATASSSVSCCLPSCSRRALITDRATSLNGWARPVPQL